MEFLDQIGEVVRPAGACLSVIGLVLSFLSFFSLHTWIDRWITTIAPSPVSVLGAIAIVLFVFNWIIDFLLVVLSLLGVSNGFMSVFSFVAPFVVGAVVAMFLCFTILYFMAKARGGFIASLSLIVSIGAILTLLG